MLGKSSFIAIGLIACLFINTEASTLRRNNTVADQKFIEGLYSEALPLYLEQINSGATDPIITYRTGLCYLFLQKEVDALAFLEKVGKLESHEDDLNRTFYLARAQHLNNRFNDAKKGYDEFLKFYLNKEENFNEIAEGEVVEPAIYGKGFDIAIETISIEEAIKKLKDQCDFGIEMNKKPKRVAIENAGPNINSELNEFAPVISADGKELFFTMKKDIGNGMLAERLFFSKYEEGSWSKPDEIQISTDPDTDIDPLYLSPENDLLLIYNSSSNNGDIFKIEKQGDFWLGSKSMGKPINSKNWEPSASLFPDRSAIIFSSNRPDGYGGLDLYISRQIKANKWSTPENLGPEINTQFDDDAPFVQRDGKTLFFSSRGHLGIGGYDVFKTSLDSLGNWTTPENLGVPINTPNDDIYFTWTGDERRAFFASHRSGSYGGSDIYYMDFNQISLNVYAEKMVSGKREPINDFEVSLEHMQSGKFISTIDIEEDKGLTVFLAKENDMYMLRIKAPGYVPYVESMSLRRGNELVAYQNKEIVLNPRDVKPDTLEKVIILEEEPKNVAIATKTEEPKLEEPVKPDPIADAAPSPVRKSSKGDLTYRGRTYKRGDILKQKVHFILNESEFITDYSKAQMDIIIAMMKANPTVKLNVIAHADKSGKSEYNTQISQQRANSVASYFVENGIAESRLIKNYKGDQDLLIDTNAPELKNRRVEFILAEL